MIVTCSRCGMEVPRLTTAQIRCVPCQREVDNLIQRDTERRSRRVGNAKDLTEWRGR